MTYCPSHYIYMHGPTILEFFYWEYCWSNFSDAPTQIKMKIQIQKEVIFA